MITTEARRGIPICDGGPEGLGGLSLTANRFPLGKCFSARRAGFFLAVLLSRRLSMGVR